MKLEEFRRLYQIHIGRLEGELDDLRRKLSAGIQLIQKDREARGIPPKMFRIRIRDFRVKDCDSLYQKIVADHELDFENAFETGHVRDLIGARLVCHNLRDVEEIVETLQKGRWGGLHHVLPAHGEKKWLETAQKDSGYRGWHVDVRWQPDGVPSDYYAFAELQVRTSLQDAWATFMHDDIYKDRGSLLFPDEVFGQFKDMSNILYALDQMAERIRNGIEVARVGTKNRISALESVSKAMFALLAYAKVSKQLPEYSAVERKDAYTILGDDGLFCFELDAECLEPKRFVFPLAGNTPHELVESITVEQFSERARGWKQINWSNSLHLEKDSSNPNAIVITHNPPRVKHRYRISCRWKDVFSKQKVEYVWCPWASTYGSSLRKYSLSIIFDRKPTAPPRLLRVRDFDSIGEMTRAAEMGLGELGTMTEGSGQVLYSFSIMDPDHDFLCLFQR